MAKPGTVILLNGTSSSGKSAILDHFAKLHPKYKIFKIDDWFPDEIKRKASSLGWSDESKVNPWQFIVAYAEQKAGHPLSGVEVRGQLFQGSMIMYAAGKAALKSGENIIIDTVFEHEAEYAIFNDFFKDSQPIKIFVYCPLDILLERVDRRNKSGKPEEIRTALQSFEQFPAIYKIQDSDADQIVDQCDTATLRRALERAIQMDYEIYEHFAQGVGEVHKPRFENFKEHFIEAFKLNQLDRINLAARHPYDLILNSGINSPGQLAEEIDGVLQDRFMKVS